MESGSDTILKKINKRFRKDDVRHASDLLMKHGIRRMGFLLLGSPGETRQTVMESLQFADSLELEMVKVTVGIRVYPDTDIAHHAKQIGTLSLDDNLLSPRFYIEMRLSSIGTNDQSQILKSHIALVRSRIVH